MSIRPPPRYAVHPVHAPPPAPPRRKLWWTLAWIGSVLVAIAIGYVLGNNGPAVVPGNHHNARQLAKENAQLKQQLAIAQRSQQVASVASKKLTDNLAERDEQINGLRADLAFYSRLVGGGTQHQGLQLQMVHATPVPGSRAWNIELTLTRNAKRGNEVSGHAEVDVDGVRAGSLTRMHWKDISAPDQKDGLDFKFKYFQQLHGTVMLPKGFTPNRLRISISPKGAKTTTQSMSWTDALKNPESTDHVE
ncbi:DUF6776 family protein [Oleiagrimonas sp. MCCC 1A03011]|uniref:DUF6776 family protein n=1 Tax=Oleiagrimonas sp. MCCC 1A03011 TaxID=1926883 RepID=UPI000DC58806|nr:DUF6776 family protein [Oleiagrimonas sp. MCCC 1A03011]RAP56888.1 hypothetical protein BTJ49_12115 [Oleiagrimonas sp. MCCC 1A03011]